MLTITGTFLDSERTTGTFVPDGETEPRGYDFTALKLLVESDVVKVRLPKDVHVHPFTRGEEVTLSVTVPARTKIVCDVASLDLAHA